jgi:hypothetical protein
MTSKAGVNLSIVETGLTRIPAGSSGEKFCQDGEVVPLL